MINRRTFPGRLAASAAAALASPSVFADSNKPLRVLVGFSAGGSSDVAARILGDHSNASSPAGCARTPSCSS